MKHETNTIDGIPFYKIGTFGGEANAFISSELYEEYKSKYPYPKKGQILISAAGTLGKMVIFDGKPAYFQDSNIVWVNTDEKIINNQFFYYCLRTVDWKKYATEGSIIPRIYNESLRNIQIPVPPLAKQQEIVAKIESYEAEIAKLEVLMAQSASKKQAILSKYL